MRPLRAIGTLVLLSAALPGPAEEARPGVWGGRDLSALPLPTAGYDVYLVGELHGVKENVDVLMQYASALHARAGVRDIALEEKPAYQREAQAYVEGRSDALPPALCLRAAVLDAIRDFNKGRTGGEALSVHLVDVDINPEAIQKHLRDLTQRIAGASKVPVPAAGDLKARGLETVAALERLAFDPETAAELRTVRHSIRAHQQGLSAGTGGVVGSPYLDDREDAIVSNIRDVLRTHAGQPILALYGTDHVSKTMLHNGGPKQDRDFEPTALRLGRAGVKVFSLVTIPLSGASSWRGRTSELIWSAKDGSLSTGETLDTLLAAPAAPEFLYIDPRREPAKMPTSDLTRSHPDGFLLYAHGTAAENRCAAPSH